MTFHILISLPSRCEILGGEDSLFGEGDGEKGYQSVGECHFWRAEKSDRRDGGEPGMKRGEKGISAINR